MATPMAQNGGERGRNTPKGYECHYCWQAQSPVLSDEEGDNRTEIEVWVEDVGTPLLCGTAEVARNPRDGQSAPQSGAWGNTRQQPQGGFGQQEGWGGTSQQSPQQPAQGGWGRRHRPGRTTRRICRNPSRTSNKPWTNSHHSDPIFSPRHVLTQVF